MPSEFSVINVMTINNWEIVMTARLLHHRGAQGGPAWPSPEHAGRRLPLHRAHSSLQNSAPVGMGCAREPGPSQPPTRGQPGDCWEEEQGVHQNIQGKKKKAPTGSWKPGPDVQGRKRPSLSSWKTPGPGELGSSHCFGHCQEGLREAGGSLVGDGEGCASGRGSQSTPLRG